MKTLLLMRHGKSSWDDPALPDHDRPLAPRGQRASALVGAWLRREGLIPDAVLLSSAARVSETWERVQSELAAGIAVTPERSLYMIWSDALIRKIRQTSDSAEVLLVVNHEPTLSHLTETLAKPPVAVECTRAFHKFPTAAVAQLEFDTSSWTQVRPGAGRFVNFVWPKQLA